MQIRPMVASDRLGWNPLWQGYLTFYKASVDAATTDLTFERLTKGTEPMGAFIAIDERGAAVGMVHWILHRSCWSQGDYCYLQDLFVVPGLRGQGLGRQLIEAVYAKSAAVGANRVWWLTHESNTDAMHLYEKIATRSGFLQYRKML
ncbi:MAG: GNAT family N-acetyltransferase [Pseudomonadota bacterium]|jgi:GNAT superfamily N-acetyltransferase